MNKFNARKILRRMLAEEPEKVFQALVDHMADMERSLRISQGQVREMKAAMESHRHGPLGKILVPMTQQGQNEVMAMGLRQSPMNRFCSMLQNVGGLNTGQELRGN